LEKICNAEGVKVAKGVIPLVVRASGGSVRDAQSVLGQLLAGAGKDGVTYEIAVQLLGYTDGALLDDAIDALAARDGATLFSTVDRVIESGHDPRRFASDLLERLRDLMIVDALGETNPAAILREIPDDQLERMRAQAKHIGSAGLSRSADIAAEGLTQMRGATAPRLMLELICARMLLPIGDASESGMLSRIERLERAESISIPASRASDNVQAKKQAEPVAEVPQKVENVSKPSVEKPAKKAATTSNHTFDVAGLRRLWPDVIEDVKKRRRLTWSLLSASAQIIAVDDKLITIGIVNAGARDSFLRSNSDEILRQAFIEVVGIDRKIEAIIDPSVEGTPQSKSAPTKGESLDDPQAPSGLSLLASELGAEVIKVEEHE
ncbi:MAG: DNA polymerase III subunit gamma/tau, partial [Candidatus Nanopelagicaceae bacterium]